ncbi:hypothetical protein [Variovorax sp. LjRoot178]|uniref:hypothetical protein n=1 Tax=Variovorax sp. LjRoot178 TaxID=3342277 RepID=UPI003ECE3FF6
MEATIDLGWFITLSENKFWTEANNTFISGQPGFDDEAVRNAQVDQTLVDIQNGRSQTFSDALLFLEQIVVNEVLLVDRTALELLGLQIPEELEPFIQLRKPDSSVYRNAVDRALEFAKSAKESTSKAISTLVQQGTEGDAKGAKLYVDEDKLFAERLVKMLGPEYGVIPANLADSNDSLFRTFFYLEFARYCGAIPILSPNKRREWLYLLKEAARLTPQEAIEDRVRNTLLAPNANDFRAAFTTDIPVPPVRRMILRLAAKKQMSLLSAASEIRENENAQSYRSLLSRLSKAFGNGLQGEIDAASQLKQLDDVVRLWGEHGDPRIGVDRQIVRLSLEFIPFLEELLGGLAPGAGGAASLVGKLGVDVNLPAFSKAPGYLMFVSSWFRDPERPRPRIRA